MQVRKRGVFSQFLISGFSKFIYFIYFFTIYIHQRFNWQKYSTVGDNNQISTLAIKYNSAMATMKASTIPMITLWKRNKTDDCFIFAIWELALHGQNLAPIHNPILLTKPVTMSPF